jgi:carboxyl-terminal processing protease
LNTVVSKQNNSINEDKQLIPLLTAISLVLGIFIGVILVITFSFIKDAASSTPEDTNQNGTQSISGEYDTELIEQVLKKFETTYIKDLDKSDSDISYSFIKGFVNSLDDKYTSFLDPEEAKQYMSSSSGEFQGVGIILAFKDDYTYVETVLEEYPAHKAGVKAGDVIVKVDGQDMAGEYPSIVATKIRGEQGTKVKIEILRKKDDSTTESKTFDITRQKIEVDPVSWEKIDSKTARISISQFTDESVSEFNTKWDNTITEIMKELPDLRNVVVDLRNNPGGYVVSVRYVAEEFLESDKVIMKERSKQGGETTYRDERKGKLEKVKLTVIVNEGSASASEIFAAAIQDNDRGEIIGQKTVGKGVEQERVTFEDGSMLLIVFQEWLTPKGRVISEEAPITPDKIVEYSAENFEEGNDTQLKAALELF